MNKISITSLKQIAAAGGGMIIDSSISVTSLKQIAAAVNTGGGTVTINAAHKISVTSLKQIAAAGGGKVVFDFTNESFTEQ